MIELQVINRVLKTKSMGLLVLNNIDESYFLDYKEEISYIFEHYRKYGNVPDEVTFFTKFDDCESIIVSESDDFLIKTLNENYLYSKAEPIINKTIELAQTNANDAIEYLLSKTSELTSRLSIDGIDIMKTAQRRLDRFKEIQKDLTGSLRVSTTLPELNDLLFGGFLCGEELVTVLARPNEGKSWILQLIAVSAWLNNIPVLIYSGEMSDIMVGYRADTEIKNFSNTALMTGNFSDDVSFKEYEDYIKMCTQSVTPFIVVTRKELGGKATVTKLAALVEKHNAGILIIDQYSIMKDERRERGDQKRDEFGHITDDLLELSIKYKIPVVGASQANREGARKKGEEGESLTPALEHCAESDQIVQNSSRVLSIRQDSGNLEICKRKDRYFGRLNESVFYRWNIDLGKFIYIPDTKDHYDTNRYNRVTRKETADTDVF